MRNRLAVYFVPEDDSPLGIFGGRLLGRLPRAGTPVERASFPGPRGRGFERSAEKAGRYGFHATLVAPFVPRVSEKTVANALKEFSKTRETIRMPGLAPKIMPGRFAALVPGDAVPESLGKLEKALVETMDEFRDKSVPPKDRGPLTERQKILMKKWGYPRVLGEFRFHLTLAGDVDENFFRLVGELMTPAVLEPFAIDSLSLSREDPDGIFRLVGSFRLGLPETGESG
ncbi:MAG: DUF1045 domain-containing protein [Deltaproteobacteria bacterium]|jgi:hypothetical protein|nr:DUF1045 domain-containing protein [Deltaproteobacteria bacterium]